MIYLDRARRADMRAGFAAIDKRLDSVDRRFDRQEKRFDRVDERMLHLTGIVIDLARGVGELSGRVTASAPVEVVSAAE